MHDDLFFKRIKNDVLVKLKLTEESESAKQIVTESEEYQSVEQQLIRQTISLLKNDSRWVLLFNLKSVESSDEMKVSSRMFICLLCKMLCAVNIFFRTSS